jgi:hypothetical protein
VSLRLSASLRLPESTSRCAVVVAGSSRSLPASRIHRSVRFAVSPESNGFSSTSTATRSRPIRPIRGKRSDTVARAGRRPRPISWSDRFVIPVTIHAGVRDGRVLAPDGLATPVFPAQRGRFRCRKADGSGRPRQPGGLDWPHRPGFSPRYRGSAPGRSTGTTHATADIRPIPPIAAKTRDALNYLSARPHQTRRPPGPISPLPLALRRAVDPLHCMQRAGK